jgi:tetratricopeptide (TPR) repeat protein
MRRPLAVSLLTLLSLAACDRGATSDESDDVAKTAKADAEKPDAAKPDAAKADAAKPDVAKPDAAKSDAAGAKPSAERKPNTFKAPTREEAAAKKKALQEHLDAGRKAVTEKDYERGIMELEKAIAINPLHAKSLGELGWAYFNAGKLDEAKDRLERGLQYAESEGTRGAILYNLGRVAEAKGDTPHAIELYGRSLAARPNDAVSKRLADLGTSAAAPSEAAPVEATHSQCSFAKKGTPWGNLCWGQLGELGVDVNDPAVESHPECGYGQTTLDPEGGAISAGGEVSVYELTLESGKIQATVFSYYDLEMFDETFMLAVVVDGVLYTANLAWVSHPGVGYADENVDSLELRSEDIVPGGRPELVIEWSISGHDLDPGIEEEEFWSSERVAFVSLEGGVPQWLAALTTASERTRGPMTSWEDGSETPPPVAEPTTKDTRAITLDTSGGKLSVAANGEASAPVGSFAFAEYPQRCPSEL